MEARSRRRYGRYDNVLCGRRERIAAALIFTRGVREASSSGLIKADPGPLFCELAPTFFTGRAERSIGTNDPAQERIVVVDAGLEELFAPLYRGATGRMRLRITTSFEPRDVGLLAWADC